MNTFVELFPYLSIDMVWLLHKKKPGDGVQGWQEDLALGFKITKTIMAKLACIIKRDKGKEEQELKAMGEYPRKEYTMDLCETKQKSHRENAAKKNHHQAINAVKSIKRREKTARETGASPGAVVSLKVDYQTNVHAHGLVGIAYYAKEETGRILV